MLERLPTTLEPELDSVPTTTACHSRRRRWLAIGLLSAGAVYSWLFSDVDLGAFKPIAVAVPIICAAVIAFRSWVHHDRKHRGAGTALVRFGGIHHRAVAAWASLAVLLIAWELRELTASPRNDYPTVTSLVGTVTSYRPVNALAFLAWLFLGYRLIERGK
jgi:hypothetical protein